ncbi:hypothetical protein GCM10017589_13050 [Streptomyces poonensis]|nr:hypothetical protein GCM10017589_13050 [Streptomyces poonensis]
MSSVIQGFGVMRRRTTMVDEIKTFVARRTDELLLIRGRPGVVAVRRPGSAASVRRGYDAAWGFACRSGQPGAAGRVTGKDPSDAVSARARSVAGSHLPLALLRW